MRRLLFVAFAVVAGSVAADERDAFHQASLAIGVDDARAAQLFEAIAEGHPDDEYADDALLEAAELAEERLGRPDHAAELYARLIARYPTSRLSLRARARHDFLVANLRSGAAPLAEYQEILLRYATRPPEESAARMEKLLAAHPDFSLAAEGRLWLARGDLAAGRFASAMRRYREIEERYAGAPAAREAHKGRADATLAAGHPLAARRLYQSLASDGDRITAEVARAGVAATTRALLVVGLFFAALGYLGGFLAVGLRQGRSELRRMPLELKFYLPIALLFLVAGATESRAICVATSVLAIGGAVVIWSGGAATAACLRRGPLSFARRLARAAATATAIVALFYATVHATHLEELVVETLRNGPDR